MKTWRILVAVMLTTTCLTGYSQQNDGVKNIKKFLKNYLNHTGELNSQTIDCNPITRINERDCDTSRNIQIDLLMWNLLSNNPIRHDGDLNEIGIFGFRKLIYPIQVGVLMKYHNFFEVLSMIDESTGDHRDYSAILDDLQKYFAKHPDIDYRLLPLYNKAILDIYIANTQSDELGPWFEWYETEQYKYLDTK